MPTEFGGIPFAAPASDDVGSAAGPWGYSRAADASQFASLFSQIIDTVIHTQLSSGFCHTQFADTFQEASGHLYVEGTPKIPLEVIAAAVSASRTHMPGGVWCTRERFPRWTAAR